MKKLLIMGVLATALAFTVSASAAVVPWVYAKDSADLDCVKSTYIKKTKTLHLEKNCSNDTVVAAGAEVTGVSGQTFQSASFTLANASQCHGGSPRFNVDTTTGFFFLGCNNVTPTTNTDGTVTYTFTAATLAAAGQQVPTPTGTIESVNVLIDIQGTADLTKVMVNGKLQKLAPGKGDFARACKKGGWKTLHEPEVQEPGSVRHVHRARKERGEEERVAPRLNELFSWRKPRRYGAFAVLGARAVVRALRSRVPCASMHSTASCEEGCAHRQGSGRCLGDTARARHPVGG